MQELKEAIKTKLQTITELQDVYMEDVRKDPLDQDIPLFPVAFIGAGSIQQSDFFDDTTSQMTFVFPISVLMKSENFTEAGEVEALMFKIVKMFAQKENINLGSNCNFVRPSTTGPQAFQHKNRQLVSFDIQLEVRSLVSIID